MNITSTAAVLLTALLASSAASAETLNFKSLAAGPHNSPVNLPRASISGNADILYLNEFFVGEGGSICAAFTTSTSTSCTGDLQIRFTSAVTGLVFSTAGFDLGDKVDVSVFDGVQWLGMQTIEADSQVDFAALPRITRILIDDQSLGHNSGAGYAYGRFAFTVLPSVPEPGTWLMMGLGLAAVGGFCGRRKVG